MTNAFAIWFGAVILALVGFDYFVFGGETLLFLAKKGLDLLEWMAFWR